MTVNDPNATYKGPVSGEKVQSMAWPYHIIRSELLCALYAVVVIWVSIAGKPT